MASIHGISQTPGMRTPALPLLGVLLAGCVQTPPRHRPLVEPEPERPAPIAIPEWQSIGSSVEGRPIRYRRIGRGYRQVLWIGGIHGDEIEGMVATSELPTAFLRQPGLPNRVTLHQVEDMNPDGRAAQRRTNLRGVDLNRDFPASNRTSGSGLTQPESRVIHELIQAIEPDLVVVAHSWRDRYFINYDGPARPLARLFARKSGFPVVPSESIAATPGSLGSWCGWDRHVPTLTLEWRRGTLPAQAWEQTREAILAVIRGNEEPAGKRP
ncbi:MAG: succinylglutamate desuccinylase/aspartoacylase family protein [Planctomycetes bacterium]|nr:succinylglutamate desuccinylase/aspartoacylase family protein [Planctomycetota bacterium]